MARVVGSNPTTPTKESEMATVNLSIHGGRCCDDFCRWRPDDICDFGSEDGHMCPPADRAVIALDKYGHLVGAWLYDRRPNKRISSCGTWVAPKYRKNGLAKKLWEFGIIHENPKKVSVIVITDRGYSLAHAMKEKFPKIKWDIAEDADRKLRKLSRHKK